MKTFTFTTPLLVFAFLFATSLHAHTNFVVTPPKISHEILNELLQEYVSDIGKVDYEGLKKEEAKLKSYIDLLASVAPSSNWKRDEQIAYWINAYNAHALYMVVKAYPVASILKVDGANTFTTNKLNIGGQLVTLNEIENDILIGKFYEPRIHFAINNTAKSCPPLMAKAWTGEKLNLELNERAYDFINNKKYNNVTGDFTRISKVFKWKAKDFREIKTYINQYSPVNIPSNAEIKYFEYDWSLNVKIEDIIK